MSFQPRGRGRKPRIIDGRGHRESIQRARRIQQANAAETEKRRELESQRVKVPAPVLTSLSELEEVVGSAPEHPIYLIKIKKTSIRRIGQALFGPEGYNRCKREEIRHEIGPHFDAYAGHFSPWTLHRNIGRLGCVRAMFLPSDEWSKYIESTNGLSRSGISEQEKRFRIGEKQFATGDPLTTARIVDGTMTLLWHGSVDDATLPGPSVHEFIEYPRPYKAGQARQEAKYEVYAQQQGLGDFKGFMKL